MTLGEGLGLHEGVRNGPDKTKFAALANDYYL